MLEACFERGKENSKRKQVDMKKSIPGKDRNSQLAVRVMMHLVSDSMFPIAVSPANIPNTKNPTVSNPSDMERAVLHRLDSVLYTIDALTARKMYVTTLDKV